MTQKVAVVTDSVACLTREQVERYGIQIIPINFYAGGKVYRDWIDVSPSEAYEMFLQDPESFKTSPAPPEECISVYRAASQRAKQIVCVTISANLSTVSNIARGAGEQIMSEEPDISVEVIDSETATAGEGFIALAAARAAAEGKDLPQVIAAARDLIGRVNVICFLDTIRHVYRSGRIPKVASQVGSLLSIKPILTVSGKVHFEGAVRNQRNGIRRILNMMTDRVGGRPVHVAVMHAYAPNEAESLKQRIASQFNCVELWLTEFSPVMGYACGTGTLGIAFYADGV